MWTILNGTLVNTATVAVGSTLGLLLGARVPDRYQRIILDCLGLITISLGIDAAVIEMGNTVRRFGIDPAGNPVATYGARLAMVTVASLIIGAIIGTALRLHDRIEQLGHDVHQRFTGPGDVGAARFARGFLSASVIFCVGPLTLLGCLKNGTEGDPSYLYIKACLDGFCSMALAASLGVGVAFSTATVLVFQGALAVTAYYVAADIPPLSLALMNVVGGILLLGTALLLLEIKKIPVANLLPALFLPPLGVWLVETIAPNTLMLAQ